MLNAQEKARLSWHCRRGMLELDLILHRFLEKGLDLLSKDQIQQFDSLLSYTDPELFAWLMGHEVPSDKELAEIVAFIRAHS
ncbi:succinate dehydrogenase assembly factor 2 [Legionella sp. km772]|uniref:FAD assembly factor SdhE n=1 Tax=Legionella sp. km772 TaxID=2498111 RepID=UPI000F8CBCC8|nr:succinate dehydrogenase assembly factor 2 [Legionella sp. km772]RUR13193.1 succinate dehydrogenase assembly factor 2 family protein [Legionella sp. km772]